MKDTNQDKATARPWEILKQAHTLRIGHKEPSQWATGGFTWEFVGRPILESKSGAKRGQSPNWYGWPEAVEANAALIVRAVNEFDALNAVAEAFEILYSEMGNSLSPAAFDEFSPKAKEAASKAHTVLTAVRKQQEAK